MNEDLLAAAFDGKVEQSELKKPTIVMTGVGGTGKTTLMNLLAAKLDLPIVASRVRDTVAKFGIHTEDDQHDLSDERAWEMQLAIQLAMAEGYADAGAKGAYISDRSMLDPLSYTLWRDTAMIESTPTMLATMEFNAFEHLSNADLVIYCPFGVFDPEPDGHRTQSEAERCLTDSIIAGYLRKFGAKVKILNMTVSNLDVRVQHSLHALRLLGWDLPKGSLPATGTPFDKDDPETGPARYAYARPKI